MDCSLKNFKCSLPASMWLLKKLFPLMEAPGDLSPDEDVWQICFIQEIFTDYLYTFESFEFSMSFVWFVKWVLFWLNKVGHFGWCWAWFGCLLWCREYLGQLNLFRQRFWRVGSLGGLIWSMRSRWCQSERLATGYGDSLKSSNPSCFKIFNLVSNYAPIYDF